MTHCLPLSSDTLRRSAFKWSEQNRSCRPSPRRPARLVQSSRIKTTDRTSPRRSRCFKRSAPWTSARPSSCGTAKYWPWRPPRGLTPCWARCREFQGDTPRGVLVKLPKPGQERRVDLPVIGPPTVHNAAAANLKGIAIEAGGALVLDRRCLIRTADAEGLFVVGVTVEDQL